MEQIQKENHRFPESTTLLWIAGGLGIIATAVAAVLPILLGVWQAQLGLNVNQAGFVAATELLAQVVGTGLFVWANRRWSWRTIAAIGLAVMIGGNLASSGCFNLISLIATRAFAGGGSGIVRALSMMCLAKALNPGRAFAIYAAAQVALAAGSTLVMHQLVAAFGPHAPFIVVSAIAALGLVLSAKLPRDRAISASGRGLVAPSIPTAALLALGGLFLYFLGQGAFWTYLEPIGKSQAISATGISRALALLNVAGVVGALGIGALAHRFNPRIALILLLAIGVFSVVGVFNSSSSGFFIACSCGFYFSWCASFPFQFTLVAHADGSGNASATVPALDGLGLASGAALAGMMLPSFGLVASGWIYGVSSACGVACYAVSASISNGTNFQRHVHLKSDAAIKGG